LLTECEWAGAEVRLKTRITSLERCGEGMRLETSSGVIDAGAVVIATGGLSIPTMGATGFGYDIARQFGLGVTETRAALVPFTLTSQWRERAASLAGVSCPVTVEVGEGRYHEPMLFTHRGVSGPAMLQASSHWQPGMALSIDLLPEVDVAGELVAMRHDAPKRRVSTWLGERLPKRLAQAWCEWHGVAEIPLGALSNHAVTRLEGELKRWQLKPAGTEGWRTAEVTLGGVETQAISSKTFAVEGLPALRFIGEALDVTGQLGGFNFQWAWASGVACGQAL